MGSFDRQAFVCCKRSFKPAQVTLCKKVFGWKKLMKRKDFLGFVGPSAVMMVLLMLVPLLMTLALGFTAYTYGTEPQFVGFANYSDVLQSPRFWGAVWFTLFYTAVAVSAQILLGVGVAMLLDSIARRIRGALITVFLLPFIVTPVVGTLTFSFLLSSPFGLVDFYLRQIGLEINWFGAAWPARAALILHAIWYVTPFVVLVTYAALQGMPKELPEAAKVDGANWLQTILFIKLPYLKTVVLFAVTITIMDLYRMFDSVFVLTSGGPGSSTETLGFYNYSVAFNQQSLGEGSAISILTVIGIFIVLAPFMYLTYREQVHEQ